MAKIPSTRRITTEDFPPKDRALVSKLAFAINPFLDSIVNAFNKNLTINDNFNAQDTEIEFTAPVSVSNPVMIKSILASPVRGVEILRIDNLTNQNALLSAAPFIQFVNAENNNVKIYNITGLTSGTKYRMRVIFHP